MPAATLLVGGSNLLVVEDGTLGDPLCVVLPGFRRYRRQRDPLLVLAERINALLDESNSALPQAGIDLLIDTKADVNGNGNIYYVLGDHSLSGDLDWATCLKRPFFVPNDQAQLIVASRTVKRFMEVVEPTTKELAAVQDDCNELEASAKRTQHPPVTTTMRKRAKEAKSRGIPLTVLNRKGKSVGSLTEVSEHLKAPVLYEVSD